MSVLIAQPSVAPFVQQAALAFAEENQLGQFCSTVAYQPQRLLQQWMFRFSDLAGARIEKEFSKRRVDPALMPFLKTYTWKEYLRLLSSKLDSSGVVTDYIWEWAETGFDAWAASQISSQTSLVYGYEHACLSTFRRSAEIGVPVVYDVPAPETTRIRSLMAEEIQKFPELDSSWFASTSKQEPRRLARRKQEWDLAGRIICASEFTKATFTEAGYDTSKVRVVPYGAPPPLSCAARAELEGSQVKLIWAGTFSLRKGAYYLLEAWKQLQPHAHARLDIYGAIALPQEMMQELPLGVYVHDPVPRNTLMEIFKTSDALVFPTLYDGFGMVVTEALAMGLPVITTCNAGAAQFIREGENGYFVKPGDTEDLKRIIEQSIIGRKKLHNMKPNCLAAATAWQWADYRKALRRAVSL